MRSGLVHCLNPIFDRHKRPFCPISTQQPFNNCSPIFQPHNISETRTGIRKPNKHDSMFPKPCQLWKPELADKSLVFHGQAIPPLYKKARPLESIYTIQPQQQTKPTNNSTSHHFIPTSSTSLHLNVSLNSRLQHDQRFAHSKMRYHRLAFQLLKSC